MKLGITISLLSCSLMAACGAPPPQDDAVTQTDEALFSEPTDTTPRTPGPKSVVYTAEAVIDAPIGVVWNALVDLPGYAKWNPWVKDAKGDVTPGGDVSVKVVMGPITQSASHKVLAVDPNARLCWRDAGWNSRFVYGQRCRWLEQRADGKVHFTQALLLDPNDGLNLTSVAKIFNGPCLQAGMDSESRALKAYAEAKGGTP